MCFVSGIYRENILRVNEAVFSFVFVHSIRQFYCSFIMQIWILLKYQSNIYLSRVRNKFNKLLTFHLFVGIKNHFFLASKMFIMCINLHYHMNMANGVYFTFIEKKCGKNILQNYYRNWILSVYFI